MHHWQCWVVMINGGERAYFQTHFDAFLIIFFTLSGIPCGVIPDFIHRRTDWGWLSTQACKELLYTSSGNEPVRIWYFPWNLACWFHCFCATSMPDFIGISFKQTPWLKFDFLKIVAGRGQENIGTAMFSSPKKIVCSTYEHQMFARLIKKVQCYYKSSSFKLKMGVFMMKKGWSLASSLKSSLLMPSGFM